MKKVFILLWVVFVMSSMPAYAVLGIFDKRPAEEQREGFIEQSQEILNELYAMKPEARQAVESAYGYATFSNFGMKIFLAGGGSGRGIAISNKTDEKVYMKMAEIQAGLGLGVKKFMLVWVFENKKAFDQFVHSGWEFGGQASAAAKYDEKGGSFQGAVAVAPGVWLYQMTDKGLALELTVKGTKYFKDKTLNK